MLKSNSLLTGSALVLVLTVTSCTSSKTENSEAPVNTGINLADLDTTVSPATDFYQFANGTWLKNNPVPPSESRWGSFNELRESNAAILKEVLEEAAADQKAASGSNRKKIGDFFATGMDSLQLNKQGNQPLQEEMKEIGQIANVKGVLAKVAEMQAHFNFAMFAAFAEQDMKNSTRVLPYLYQGGLSLPDRDYYLKTDEASVKIREQFKTHITSMLKLAGEEESAATTAATAILDMETRMAKASMSRVEMRNPEKTYNLKTVAEMQKLAPAFEWNEHLMALGVQQPSEMVVNNPAFFAELNKMLTDVSLDGWKSYLKWRTVSGAAPYLSDDFRKEDFSFNEGVLNGAKEMKERWKLVQETIDQMMGEALGQVYCEKAFTPETKKRMMELVNNLGLSFQDRIQSLDWMSDATKEQAQIKLKSIMKKIGYPDKWRDYSDLEISRSSYYQNVQNAAAFEHRRIMKKIGQPVDRTEWGISPPTVNAYYNPSMNEIVFPAGILQPPFFNPSADDAVNYGGIGAVIGHEMTHGFDDEGRQFDAQGNLKSWWTSEDSSKFMAKASMLVEQYGTFTVNDSLKVNGQLTLGENIADLGGLTIAYYAFRKSLEGKPEPAKIDGFTADQRFFLGWATVWRSNITPENAAQRIMTDPHSPTKYRCNGIVSNLPEFYKAFNVKAGDAMYREENKRAAIW